MKVNIAGDTPLERLTNFAKKVVAVPKSEVAILEKKWRAKKHQRKPTKR